MNTSSPIETNAGWRECLLRDIARLGRTRAYLKPSKARIAATILGNRGLQALILHRLSHELWKRRVPVLPLILVRLMQFLFAVDIAPSTQLGPGIVIFHGFGLVIGTQVRIEGDCALYQGVTLGDRGSEWVSSARTMGIRLWKRT